MLRPGPPVVYGSVHAAYQALEQYDAPREPVQAVEPQEAPTPPQPPASASQPPASHLQMPPPPPPQQQQSGLADMFPRVAPRPVLTFATARPGNLPSEGSVQSGSERRPPGRRRASVDEWGGSLGDVLAQTQVRERRRPADPRPPSEDDGAASSAAASAAATRRRLVMADSGFSGGLGEICPPRPPAPPQRPRSRQHGTAGRSGRASTGEAAARAAGFCRLWLFRRQSGRRAR